jgi:hypothetical protein
MLAKCHVTDRGSSSTGKAEFKDGKKYLQGARPKNIFRNELRHALVSRDIRSLGAKRSLRPWSKKAGFGGLEKFISFAKFAFRRSHGPPLRAARPPSLTQESVLSKV